MDESHWLLLKKKAYAIDLIKGDAHVINGVISRLLFADPFFRKPAIIFTPGASAFTI